MYKCTDCGKEFEIKPEYCDCGNNTFEELVIEQPKQEVELPNSTVKEIKQTKYEDNRSILERLQISVYALIFFVVCILLAIVSVMYLGNGILEEQQNQPQEKNTVLEPVKNIPSINNIWDNTPPVSQKVEPVKTVQTVVQPIVKPVVQAVKTLPAVKSSNSKKSTTPVKVTPIKTTSPKVSSPKTKSTSQKQISSQASTKQKVSVRIPKITSQIASGTSVSQTSAQNVTQKVATVKSTTTVTKPVTDKATLQKELWSYKVALRNKIAKNINFAEVVGDGNCAVTFKIDSVGNLINRKFSVQSNNNSLNDVVYQAVMQNPSYKTPPEGYKNETLTLTVRMYGGNFEVELK